MRKFINGRIKSIGYALKGALLLIKTEHSIIAQLIIFVVLIILGFVCDISKQDWINQILAIGLVLSVEGLNTTAEKLADFVHLENHPKIGFIKDISAGAVTFAALSCLVTIILIYYPYIINLLV
ncbi:diacylglycerol kinase family protein [Maribacter sp. TH_r10]|uniref:diacylglycerol kinase n=1 Tax=Maribacter sp. TH_r10 TaxID=3082086 RepID=UPI0029542991|nr:diacylglycerol kinase family protein [Maribacter sp. TH_r10]MDV7137369.1 diacylglycerol kinase family protein [Maribacter sp. TH_r10]|tara:strand:+ start:1567 stop:1938 length:372 start_codon:yes stop_codon:yes gene_type:complete